MKLLSSETAVSEVVGHAIILGITVIGISMITLYGVPAIYSLEDMANVKNVEQAFTVLDSRASRAILGESPLQITNINLGGGTLTVEPNTTSPSYMVIKSKTNTFNVTIPMGKIKYQLGDRIVAYEGGGVWSKYPSGSVMLSPPEFHYNGVTLTLPAMNVGGNASVGGKGTATVSIKKKTTVVQYPNSSIANRSNPVNSSAVEKVYVNITSDYYDAWADYAKSLGYTDVSIYPADLTTSIELTVVPSNFGEVRNIPMVIDFRGLNPVPEPLDNFSFKIKTPGGGQKLKWDIRAKSGNKRLIFMLDEVPGNKVDLYIGYQHEGQGYNKPAETWEGEKNFTVQDGFVYVDLLNESINLTYKKLSGDVGTTNAIGCSNADKIGPSDFNNTDFSWDELIIQESPSINRTQPLYNITQHYLWKMVQEGDISFNQCFPSGNQAPERGSTMLVNYNPTGALTYLHITENRADVGIS